MQTSEYKCFQKLAKSIVSKVNIPKNTLLTRDMLTTKGPGTGISPMRMKEIIGKRTLKDIDEDIVIYDIDLE